MSYFSMLRLPNDRSNTIVTSALPCTAVQPGFLEALEVFASVHKCKIRILKQRYKIPTTKDEDEELIRKEWYPKTIIPYLQDGDVSLFDGRVMVYDRSVSATSANPLAAILTGTGQVSVLGHAKLFMRTLQRHGDSQPGVTTTTGSISEAVYSNSLAGHRSKTHHSARALVFLQDGDMFQMRHIAWDGTQIQDVTGSYSNAGHDPTNVVKMAQLSDIHASWVDPRDADKLIDWLEWAQPDTVLVGDLFNWERYSHHNLNRLDLRDLPGPEQELESILQLLTRFPKSSQIVIQDSNHHDHMLQWVERFQRPQSMIEMRDFHFYLGLYLQSLDRKVPMIQCLMEHYGFYEYQYAQKVASDERYYTHGHEGYRGSGRVKRSKYSFSSVAGHEHEPGRDNLSISVGAMIRPSNASYVSGTTSWAIAHSVEYNNGKAELLYVPYAE